VRQGTRTTMLLPRLGSRTSVTANLCMRVVLRSFTASQFFASLVR
jgi:hypothetical protein